MRACVALSFALSGACDVGDYHDDDEAPVGTPDAAQPVGDAKAPDVDAPLPVAVDDAAPVACEDAIASPGSGNHNAGRACLTCHDGGGEAPQFTLGGTLYSATSGGTAVVGATIVVTDMAGNELRLATRTNGNFYTSQAVAFPVVVRASLCPSTRVMATSLARVDSDCNGCHDQTMRIALP